MSAGKYSCVALTDGKPALLSQTRSDSGKGWKHKEATSHVSVQ